jgi:bifunctional DNA-binding transcriptional regulator/antitoxin component of YhaV-PrlF toxin-antitoxin module
MGYVVVIGVITMKPKLRKIDRNGRISIPKEFLEMAGIPTGEEVFIKLDDRCLIISDVYLPRWGDGDREKILKGYANKTKKEVKRSRLSSLVTDKFNHEWAYMERERGLSLQGMADLYEEGTGKKVDRTVFSRWIQKHEATL